MLSGILNHRKLKDTVDKSDCMVDINVTMKRRIATEG